MTAEPTPDRGPEFRLIEFGNGPSHGTDCTSGWLALVGAAGVELWRGWISPVPIEIWAEIGRAAGLRHARDVCKRGGCPNCGPTVYESLRTARLAAETEVS